MLPRKLSLSTGRHILYVLPRKLSLCISQVQVILVFYMLPGKLSLSMHILYASREVESVLKTALLPLSPLSLSLSLSLTHSLFLFLSFSLSVMDFIWTSASQGFPPKLQWRHVYQPRAEKTQIKSE